MRLLPTEALDAEWLGRLNDLKLRLAVTRPVRLLKSTLVEVPMVVGWLRPVIFVPAACFMGLTPAQLDAIIAHELAHVRRHDYLVNAFQLAIETLMFYHPAVWWISGCIREEREQCCDDIVLQAFDDRVGYARALLTLEELRAEPQFAFAATGGSLLRRVRLLLGAAPVAETASFHEFSGLALVGLACVFVVTGIVLMFGAPVYQAATRLHVERDAPGGVTGGAAGFPRADYDPYFFQTELEILQSPVVLKQAIASLKLTENWERRYGSGQPLAAGEVQARLRARLSVRPIRNTSLVEIRFCDDDPAEAASIANAIADAYRTYRTDQTQMLSSAAIHALESRLAEQDREVREAQKKVDDLRVALGITSAQPGLDSPTMVQENAPPMLLNAETLRRLENLRIENQAELARVQALLNQLKTLSLAQLVQAIPTTGVQDSLLMSLTEQLNLAEQKLVALKKEYGPEHLELIRVASQVEDLNQKIKERAAGFLAGLETKAAALQQSLVELNGSFEEAKQRDLEQAARSRLYWEAKRDLEDVERYRQVLFVKLASERTELTLPRWASVEVVDVAVAPSRPVSPKQSRAAALVASGLLLGLLGLLLIKTGRQPAIVPAQA